MQFGTARNPALRNLFAVQPSNFDGTLSHHFAPPGPLPMRLMSLSRNDSSTAFFSHWFTCHKPPLFSATLRVPLSRRSSALSTALRTFPFVDRKSTRLNSSH